ncbi:MAG: linear amide C-N hydrolase, partial [Candidatus Omnitrophota bacterium]
MKKMLFVFLIGGMLAVNTAYACTDFQIKTEDGSVIIGRSMEFAIDLGSDVMVFPKGQKFTSDAPGGGKGLKWSNRYGFVGANSFGYDAINDGM